MSGSRIPASDKASTRQEVFSPGRYQTYQRGRAIRSCLECRRRKMRCSRSQPCQNCGRFQRECVYLPPPDRSAILSPDARTKDAHSFGQLGTGSQDEGSPTFVHNDPDRLEASARSRSAVATDSGAMHDGLFGIDADDEDVGNGLQIGRLRITERIGGLFRPEVGKRLWMLLAQKNDLPARKLLPTNAVTVSQHYVNPQSVSNFGLSGTPLEPPAGLLLSASRAADRIWENYFPSREEGNVLYHQYFAAVDPLAHILHKPSFALDCYNFTSQPSNTQLTPSFKALLLAVYFAATISLPPMQCETQLGIQQQILVAKLKAATEKALIDAGHMSSVKLQTLQAFTVYMIPQCREEVSRSHIILVGALVRLAECAGLHRNGDHLSMTPTEIQMRRLLWHQICFLDIRTAESQGPQPKVREEEAETPLPWNVDDTDVDDASRRFSNIGWTDATFSLIRYECYMVHRLIFRQRVAIDNQTADLAMVRREVDQRKRTIERKYIRILDERVPVQRCAKLVGLLLTARFEPMLLQRHLQDAKRRSDLEHEIQHTLLECGLEICESAAALETATDVAPWAWYVGAYQQYHQAILLLMEVYRNPNVPYADRINVVLDFVFGKTPGSSSVERNRKMLRLLAEECTIYMQLHKAKTVEAVSEQLYSASASTYQTQTHQVPLAPQLNTNTSTQHTAPAPAPQSTYEHQEIYGWQAPTEFEINPTQCFATPDKSDWTHLPPYQSFSQNSIRSMSGDLWTDDFQIVHSTY